MRICFVGPANSGHIIKWCTWFNKHGHDVHVISFSKGEIPNTTVHFIDVGVYAASSDFAKIKYLFSGKQIKKIIDEIKPDIVNAHYATSYGTALALSGVKNYVLSVWGSDVYDFPKKSFLHKALVKYSLKKATHLFSTSKAMADEASKYTNKKFEITPFGVDMDLFNPSKRTRPRNRKPFIVGTVKTLSFTYGIDKLLQAAAILQKEHPDLDLQVRIAGDGPQADEYYKLAKQLGLEENTFFLGKITQEMAAKEWANMDIAIIPSVQESFGVAAVEAQASTTPVIISDVGGLMETTTPGKTSIVVENGNPNGIAEAIFRLYADSNLCKQMGKEGRKYVTEKYELEQCFKNIEKLFEKYKWGG